jgi:hypothetical protein
VLAYILVSNFPCGYFSCEHLGQVFFLCGISCGLFHVCIYLVTAPEGCERAFTEIPCGIFINLFALVLVC